MHMNRLRLSALIVVLCIAIVFTLIFSTLYIRNQTLKSNNQPTMMANITGFNVTWTPFPTVVGVTSVSTFDVTVQNLGTAELVGLNVTIERIADENRSNPDDFFSYNKTFSLNSSQTATIQVYLTANMLKTMEYTNNNQNFLATLTCNSTVLDQKRLY